MPQACLEPGARRILRNIMSNGSNDDSSGYEGMLLEEIRDNMKQLAESMSGVANRVENLDGRLQRVEQNTDLIPSVKAAVTDQSRQLADHDQRISDLEQAAA